MTSKLSAKFLEIFRNLKSDAIPRPPRPNDSVPEDTPQAEPQNENSEFTENRDENIFADLPKKSKKKPKYKKSFSEPNRENPETPEDDRRSSNASSTVNTQATGNVINIVNSKDVRCGNEIFYYMGPVYGHQGRSNSSTSSTFDEEEPVEKTNEIQLLLEDTNKPEHDYIDYISKHLGKNWHSFFRRLGYKQGQIETAEIDMAKHGIAEVRYHLLLDWIRNDVDGTLGKLANVLWQDGERQIVKEMAAIYNKTK